MEAYRPPPEFEEDTNDPLIDLNLTDSTELWLLQLPFGQVSFFLPLPHGMLCAFYFWENRGKTEKIKNNNNKLLV